MLKSRLAGTLAIVAFAGMAACADDGVDDDSIIMEDTITTTDTEMMEVPVQVTDTAVVQTEIEIDTMIDVDTIDDPM
jgi:hypothetical protein